MRSASWNYSPQHIRWSAARSAPHSTSGSSGPVLWARVSTKVNGETRERLGQSAKRSAAVRGQAGRGATVAGRRLPSRT
ncbi:unnamed protein product [Sphagnum balticum]